MNNKANKTSYKKGHPNTKPKRGRYFSCMICKKECYTTPKRKTQFCSNTCRGKSLAYPHTNAGCFKSGEESLNWKGGISFKMRGLRATGKYTSFRKAVRNRDEVCVHCGSDEKLHVDHIKPVKFFPELIFEITNGRLLCEICHKATDTYGHKIEKLTINDFQHV